MNEPEVDLTIRQAIGGDGEATTRIREWAESAGDARVIVMAALLDNDLPRLLSAGVVAVNSRDRQLVEIARAYLAGQSDLVDALARDHLVDHPDSLIVAWIASSAALRASSPKA
ncbi:MAG: hypothetical protein ABMA25_16335 [Ilumatobacteraceae bacterium]